ncbi:MAG TPA: alpha/beta hydrolase [Gemmatimonadaceae bacterium]|jgi:pimeloyl-ACP methyl ester carboxylesterase
MNRRVLIVAGAALLVVVLSAGGFYAAKNPESRVLDDSARRAAPGKFVRLSDGVTHYQVDGPDSGRVVVLAHGFSVPSYIWDSTAADLSRAGYRVIRYDAYGRGFSDRPNVEYSDRLYERQLGELLDSLHLAGKVDLGGVSAGGYVTGVYAGRHPDRVRSLILSDPVSGQSPATMRPYDLPVVGEYLFQTEAVPTMAEGQASDFVEPSRFPGWADKYRVQMQYKGFGHALWSSRIFRRGLDTDTIYQRVAAAHIPVLLLWGEKDQTVPFERSERVRKAIPSAEFHPIAGVGHLPILERAALTDSLILAFLGRTN